VSLSVIPAATIPNSPPNVRTDAIVMATRRRFLIRAANGSLSVAVGKTVRTMR
jgi:hypothetical protein